MERTSSTPATSPARLTSSTPAKPDSKRVLVTGGTGFVGSNLVRRLLRDGHEVRLLVRERHDPWRLSDVSERLGWIRTNIVDRSGVGSALTQFKPQWIFHLAAHGAYSWQNDGAAISATNVAGTANVLDACLEAGFEAFINTGSSSEYGFKDHAPKEDESIAPAGPYAVAKAAATQYCVRVARTTRAPIATVRLYSVYGPWEEPRRFIPQLVARGLEGRLPPLASPGTARDYIHVDDVCEAYLRIARGAFEPGSIYNVGTGVQTTLEQAVELARRLLGIAPVPVWGAMADRTWDTGTWLADSTLLARETGWRPTIDLAAGLQLTAAWLTANAAVRDRYLAASP